MKLTRLSVRRMPGFEERGFVLEDLSEGLNLVVGPNASGKSTCCRAIRGLLWPETLKGCVPVSLAGSWRENESTIRIELEGGSRRCQTGGQPSGPPPLPGSHLAECFTVTVGTLIQATGSDTDLAGAVLREMAGGYDLDAVLQKFTLSGRHGRTELKDFKNAQQLVLRIQHKQLYLQEEESGLDRLREEERESRRAQDRLVRLEELQGLFNIRSEIAKVKGSIKELPPGMDRIKGGEGGELTQLQADLESARKSREEARRSAEEAGREKEGASLGGEGVPGKVLKEQSARLERLREVQERIERIKEEITHAQSRADQALSRFGKKAEPEKLHRIERSDLDFAMALQRDRERLDARRTAAEERLAVLGREEPPEETGVLHEGIGALRQWFQTPADSGPVLTRYIIVAWALAGALVVSGLTLAVLLSPWALFAAGAGGAGGLVLLAVRFSGGENGRSACRERYERLGLDPPEKWDSGGVRTQLNRLEQRLDRARFLEKLQSEKRNREAEVEGLKGRSEQMQVRRKSLVERLGAAPSQTDPALVTFAKNLLDYREATDTLAGLKEQMIHLEARRKEYLSSVNEYLTGFGEEPAGEYRVAKVRSESIAERAETFRRAEGRLRTAQSEMTKAQQSLEKFLKRKRRLFENVGLKEDDEAGLKERLDRLPGYRKLQDKLTELRGREEAALDRLSGVPGLLDLKPEQVEAEAFKLKEIAGRHQELVDRIASISARVEQVRKENELEEALAELDRVTEKFFRSREDAREAAAGKFLLDLVREDQQTEYQPAVFRKAREWLGVFTRGRYDLAVGRTPEGGSVFRAYDNVRRRGLELGQLSGGTRMQLLLAVRLAFASDAERGVQLPFILDEALSGTDPVRFRAVVECLTATVREGRQLFYLTCQPGDAEAWREVAGQLGQNEVKFFDLARIRDLKQRAGSLLSASAAKYKEVPAPQGRSLEEYAALLGVAEVDPEPGAAGLHLAYLVDDPAELYGLLSAGIKYYGQLESLMEQSAAGAYLRGQTARKVRARAQVADAVCKAWKVGRGRPVNREVLSEVGVTDRFLDRVADLAGELHWDAKALVAALEAREDERTKGFRSSALESVVEGLADRGYLDPNEPLSRSEALNRVLGDCSEEVGSGRIKAEEVRQQFYRFWSLLCGES